MSAVIERAVDYGHLSGGVMETATARRIQQASALRWVWQPFRDIPLFDNTQPAVLNNLTLRTKEEKRKGEVVTVSDPVTVLKRCQPYPLTNCEYEIPLHERERYGMSGEELPANDLPGTYAGADPKAGSAPRHAIQPKFAYSCARELSEMYAASHGLVALEPLTGNEDAEVVKQVFDLVQPFTFPLHKLEHELTEGFRSRLSKSKAGKEARSLAEGSAELMLKGARKALANAREHAGDFSRQVQQASAGHKGNRAFPVEYDEFVFEQLGVEVPRVVAVAKANTSDELLAKLAERELARGPENDALNRALAGYEAAVAKIADLEKQVAALKGA